jgi:hypothetical protein
MKKSNLNKVLLGMSLVFLLSCKKEFLDTFPTNSVSAAEAVLTTQNGFAALNGIHRILYVQYDGQPQGGEGAIMGIRDLMGEDVIYTRANGRQDFGGHIRYIDHRNVNSGNTRFIFRFYYRVISNANTIINGIDNAEGPQVEKDIIKGQALAYRAWAHFNLVQLWGERFQKGSPNSGLGVPILTTNTFEGQARATVAAVYQQVNTDIDEAITLLDGFNRNNYIGDPATAKSHINKNVAQGFKARIALAQQEWDVAAQNAQAARQGFALMSNAQYTSGFNNATISEWIWGSHQIVDHNTFFWSFFANMGCNFNGTNTRTQPKAINSNIYNSLSATDIRKKVFSLTGAEVPIPPGGARIPFQSMKFLAAGEALSIGDVPLMRSAEMHLIEAEAHAMANRTTQAQDALFALMINRDPSYVKSTSTGTALLNEIDLHRRAELWGEGFRFTDIKRKNAPLDRTKAPNTNLAISLISEVPAGDKLWVWLFPQDELNTNPNLEQNPL